MNKKFKLSYSFFQEKAINKKRFTLEELSTHAGWSSSTARTYVGKKWRPFLSKDGDLFQVIQTESAKNSKNYWKRRT
jgi:hypothetical protein